MWSCSCSGLFSQVMICWSQVCILRMWIQRFPHSPLFCFQHTHKQKKLKMLGRSPTLVLCSRTVRNSKLLHELHTGDFFFLLFRCSLPPQMSTNSYSSKNEHCSPQPRTQESTLLPLLSKVCSQLYKGMLPYLSFALWSITFVLSFC